MLRNHFIFFSVLKIFSVLIKFFVSVGIPGKTVCFTTYFTEKAHKYRLYKVQFFKPGTNNTGERRRRFVTLQAMSRQNKCDSAIFTKRAAENIVKIIRSSPWRGRVTLDALICFYSLSLCASNLCTHTDTKHKFKTVHYGC